jgi:hypothetical protein
MLVDHLNVAAGSRILQWWPLALVLLGLMQVAVHNAKPQGRNRKDSGAEENRP